MNGTKPPRSALTLEAFGQVKTLREWAEDPRCPHGDPTLLQSRYRIGMSSERAITEPRAPWGGFGKKNRRDENPARPKKNYSRVGLAGVNHRTLTAYGESKTLREWIQDERCELGTCATLIRRIEFGMTPEQALKKLPRLPPGKGYEAFGERKGLDEWARDSRCVVGRGCLYDRIAKGMPFLEALTTLAGSRPRTGKAAPRQFSAFGETKTLKGWFLDSRCEVSFHSLVRHVQRGIPIEAAIHRIKVERPNKKTVSAFSETKSIAEWASDPRCLIAEATLRKRVFDGENPEDAMTRGIAPNPTAQGLYRPKTATDVERNLRKHNKYWGRLYEGWGEQKTLAEWSRDPRCTVTGGGLLIRLSKGIPFEEALTRRREKDVQHDIDSVLFEAFGQSQSFATWLTDPRCTIPRGILLIRLRSGMNLEQALTAPYRPKRHPKVAAFGEYKTLRDWAKDPRCEVSIVLLQGRIKKGFELETAMRADGRRKEIVLIEAFGERKCLNDWARDPRCQVTGAAIRERLRRGISLEDAITRPHVWRQSLIISAFGEDKTLTEWEMDPRTRASRNTIRRRLNRGYSAEGALTGAEHRLTKIAGVVGIGPRGGAIVEAFGEQKSLTEWAKDYRAAVGAQAILSRLRRGYPPEMAITDIPANKPIRRFWDLKKRGLEVVEPKAEHEIGPTLTNVSTSRLSDMERMEAAFRRSIGGTDELPTT